MKENNQHRCEFPIIEHLLNEATNKLAREHIEKCPACREIYIQSESAIHLLKHEHRSEPMGDEILEDVSLLVDEYIKSSQEEKSRILESNDLLKSAQHFTLFRDLLYMVNNRDSVTNVKTPEYLIGYLERSRQIQSIKPTEIYLSKLALRIKDGIQVLGSHLENIFTLSGETELVPVRSTPESAYGNESDTLSFFMKMDDNRNLVYNIMKDSTNRLMITMKFQNFTNKPQSVTLKEDGKIITTYPLKKDYAYFSKIEPGNYQIELRYSGKTITSEIIPIDITEK